METNQNQGQKSKFLRQNTILKIRAQFLGNIKKRCLLIQNARETLAVSEGQFHQEQ